MAKPILIVRVPHQAASTGIVPMLREKFIRETNDEYHIIMINSEVKEMEFKVLSSKDVWVDLKRNDQRIGVGYEHKKNA